MQDLEKQLDDFNRDVRDKALDGLCGKVNAGEITLPEAGDKHNLHCHTFYSFNAYGYSPSNYAWLARKAGLGLAGIIDFDVLDGVDEFFAAAEKVGLKAVAGIETRVYVPEFAEHEISSPGEPGITYHMGVGFANSHVDGDNAVFLSELKATASERTKGLVERVNAYLDPVVLDYEADVLPHTPAGNATERHVCLAYVLKARELFTDEASLREYWGGKLGIAAADVDLSEGPGLTNMIRSKTMKKGGVGYVQPGKDTFPEMKDMNTFVQDAGGIPTVAWLNGMSSGEQQLEQLLEVAMGSGVSAINIIPDRNFTPGVKDQLVDNLDTLMATAEKLDLPVIVGTEMNSPGLKFVDNFDADELKKHMPAFLKGAYIVYGHTVLQRHGNIGYLSPWAAANFEGRKDKNDFYEAVGKAVNPANESVLDSLHSGQSPKDILKAINQ